jgi:hemerythrin superfamily protein
LEEIKSALGKAGLKSSNEDKDSMFGILRQEHRQVQSNLQQIMGANQMNQTLLLQTINALSAHMKGEEEILYPRLKTIQAHGALHLWLMTSIT